MAREQIKRKPAAAPVEIGRGALVRDGVHVARDPWVFLADGEAIPDGADIVVSVARYKANVSVLTHAGRIGIIIKPEDAVEDIGADVMLFALIVVQFPAFRDGRGLTTARLLRERYGYKGELRASGDVLEDQLYFMLRCGFDAFEIVAADPEAAYARAARTFSHAYQSAADRRATVVEQRVEAGGLDRALPSAHLRPVRENAGSEARGPTHQTPVVPFRSPAAHAAHFTRAWVGRESRDMLAWAALEQWKGRFALVSSFGAESAVLLHLASTIDKVLPVIFLDTDRHFAQTLQYRDELVARLGLTNVRVQTPIAREAALEDAAGDLWKRSADACCALRKVRPLARALEGFDAWGTGRKRFQGGLRSGLALVEHDGTHFKVNPLAGWSAEDVAAYAAAHDLPAHPLVAQGFPSIGCWPCTKPANGRAGRWSGAEKTECGIHRSPAAANESLVSAD